RASRASPPLRSCPHDALPICARPTWPARRSLVGAVPAERGWAPTAGGAGATSSRLVADLVHVGQGGPHIGALHAPDHLDTSGARSEEHTSELQSREKLVCRPL